MTAPAATARQTPAGRALANGMQSVVTFSLDPNLEITEIGVTPPGMEGDEPIDITDQFTVKWRGFAPRELVTLTPASIRAQYDPVIYNAVSAMINKRQTITYWFPDGSNVAVYGFLRSAIPGEMADGTKPEITLTIVHTMRDPVTCEEEDPVYTAGSGTSPTC